MVLERIDQREADTLYRFYLEIWSALSARDPTTRWLSPYQGNRLPSPSAIGSILSDTFREQSQAGADNSAYAQFYLRAVEEPHLPPSPGEMALRARALDAVLFFAQFLTESSPQDT